MGVSKPIAGTGALDPVPPSLAKAGVEETIPGAKVETPLPKTGTKTRVEAQPGARAGIETAGETKSVAGAGA